VSIVFAHDPIENAIDARDSIWRQAFECRTICRNMTRHKYLTGASYLLSVIALGATTGALVARYTAASSGMGWDQIANALGGLMTGGAVGLMAGLLTVRRLTGAAHVAAAAFSLAVVAGLVLFLNQVPPPVRSRPVTPVPPPAVAPFSLTLGVGAPLEGAPYQPVSVPWQTLRIYSNLSYDFVPGSRPQELCVAAGALDTPDGIESLKALRAQLAALPKVIDCGPPCLTCADIAVQWHLDQDPFSLTVSDQCWHARPELAPVRASISRIVAMGGAATVCEKMSGLAPPQD